MTDLFCSEEDMKRHVQKHIQRRDNIEREKDIRRLARDMTATAVANNAEFSVRHILNLATRIYDRVESMPISEPKPHDYSELGGISR